MTDKETERDIFLELLSMAHPKMSNKEYKEWYSYVEQIIQAVKNGKIGVDITMDWDEHPVEFDAPCLCRLCRSYGD